MIIVSRENSPIKKVTITVGHGQNQTIYPSADLSASVYIMRFIGTFALTFAKYEVLGYNETCL